MRDLVDTTEMYLRTVYELEEEGIIPLRARIAERLDQSGPTVSQTVARMERDGLIVVERDRSLSLTERGREVATAVMRKHRLAERLLTDVLKMDITKVHAEACRWEHVMSDEVERRVVAVLDDPTRSPFGNPIPGLNDLQSSVPGAASENGGAGEANAASGNSAAGEADAGGEIGAADGSHATPENLGQRVSDLDLSQPVRATIVQINEILQLDSEQYTSISRLGFHLGLTVTIDEDERGMIRLASDDGHEIELSHDLAHAIRVSS